MNRLNLKLKVTFLNSFFKFLTCYFVALSPCDHVIFWSHCKGTDRFKAGRARKWDNPPQWFDMKENLALDKYKDNVFPGALLIGLNCGPKSDISAEHNGGQTVGPSALSRPFTNASLFKDVPTATTPQPADASDIMSSLTGNEEQAAGAQVDEPKKKKPTRADVTIQVLI